MAEGVVPVDPTPVAEVWPEWVLRWLVDRGCVSLDEVIDAAAAAASEQVAGDPCVSGFNVEVVAESIGGTWVDSLFGEGALDRLRSVARERRQGETALVVLRELLTLDVLTEEQVSGLVAGVVAAYRMAPEDGVSLVEALFGVEAAQGVRVLDDEPVGARVS